MVEQLAASHPDRFAAVTMHVNGDGYDTPWGQNRLDVFYSLGSAVPTFMFDRKSGVSGAYPAETLAAAMKQASAK